MTQHEQVHHSQWQWWICESTNQAALLFLLLWYQQRPSEEPEHPSLPSRNKELHLLQLSMEASSKKLDFHLSPLPQQEQSSVPLF